MRRLNSLFNLNDASNKRAPSGIAMFGRASTNQDSGSLAVEPSLKSSVTSNPLSALRAPRLALVRARNISFRRWRKRAGLSLGLVSLAVLAIACVWTWQTGRVDVASITLKAKTNSVFAGLGLTLQDVEIRGKREHTSMDLIRDAINANRGDSILKIEPTDLRNTLLSLPWIKDVRVDRQLPNTLVLTLREHEPRAVWQHKGKRVVLGAKGHLIAPALDEKFDELPLLTGLGANEKGSALLDLVFEKPLIASRLKQAQLIRTRRWTLTLKNGLRIHLPEENPARALEQLTNLHESDSLLSRDVLEIDMRLNDRIVVRTKPANEQGSGEPSLKVIGQQT